MISQQVGKQCQEQRGESSSSSGHVLGATLLLCGWRSKGTTVLPVATSEVLHFRQEQGLSQEKKIATMLEWTSLIVWADSRKSLCSDFITFQRLTDLSSRQGRILSEERKKPQEQISCKSHNSRDDNRLRTMRAEETSPKHWILRLTHSWQIKCSN